jgi:hypothetical protein
MKTRSQTTMIGITRASQPGQVLRAGIPCRGGEHRRSCRDLRRFNVFRACELQDQAALLVGMDLLGTLDALTIDYRPSAGDCCG